MIDFPRTWNLFRRSCETIRKAAEERAVMNNKFTTQHTLKISSILLSAEFKSAWVKSNKVSAWKPLSIADHIRSAMIHRRVRKSGRRTVASTQGRVGGKGRQH